MLRFAPENFSVCLLAAGLARYEALYAGPDVSNQVFFAHQFKSISSDFIRNHVSPRLKTMGFDPLSLEYDSKAGNIRFRIEAEIRKSLFLICDISDDNYGAYWEAGYAHGLGKPVIYTSHRDAKKSHFDIAQEMTVYWDETIIAESLDRLDAIIRKTFPYRPYKQNFWL